MSLDKAIEHHKEKRKPYRKAKAVDGTCRNHGTCKWCENNRKHKFRDKYPDECFRWSQENSDIDGSEKEENDAYGNRTKVAVTSIPF